MIQYLCDGLKPCGMTSVCWQSGSAVAFCRHTSFPEHARYGACAEPQNHPERFERIVSDGGIWNGDYIEKEPKKEKIWKRIKCQRCGIEWVETSPKREYSDFNKLRSNQYWKYSCKCPECGAVHGWLMPILKRGAK